VKLLFVGDEKQAQPDDDDGDHEHRNGFGAKR